MSFCTVLSEDEVLRPEYWDIAIADDIYKMVLPRGCQLKCAEILFAVFFYE